MAELNPEKTEPAPDARPRTSRYANPGHPSAEELMAEQGTGPIMDVSELHGDFWPEDESIEEFIATYREWRGHKREDPAP
jgi:hypothetical protein